MAEKREQGVAIYAPDGHVYLIPANEVGQAFLHGGKPAVRMLDPSTGQQHWIPGDQAEEGLSHGGRLMQNNGEAYPEGSEPTITGHNEAGQPIWGSKSGQEILRGEEPAQGFWGSVGHAIGGAVKGMGALLNPSVTEQDLEMGSGPATEYPELLARRVLSPQIEQGREAVQAAKEGRTAEAAGHGLAAITPGVGPWAAQVGQDVAGQAAAGDIGGVAGTLAGNAGVAAATEALPKGIKRYARQAKLRALETVAPGKVLDTPVAPGDLTPRERWMAANQMGVDLDLAQATNAKVPGAAKKVTEHSLAGGSKFAENTEANLRALHEHAQNLQDAIAPQMDRMEFGDQAKQALVQHVSKLNDRASELYEGLDDRLSDIKPNPSDIQEAAKKIVSENKDYYDKHPDLLKGAPAKAWAIINDLAGEKAGKPQTIKYWDNPDATSPTTEIIPAKVKPPDTWSDLHRLRSDLLDIYRGPEFVGDRPTGWLKQMVSAIDQTMNDGARTPGMTPADQKDFRAANSIYERMKKTYDDPRSPFYYMTRQDGSQVADALNRMRPEDAMRFREAMDDTGNGHLSGQLERQAVNRLLDPAGNGVPDLKNFASRWGRAQKETAGGILQPQTMQDLNDLASVARTVHQDVNPSGTGKLLQPVSEATGVISGTIGALAAGHPAVAAVPAATMLAERGIASAMTNPKVVGEAMMHTAPEPLLTTAKGIAADIDPRTATAKAAAIEAGNQPPNQSSDQQNTRDRWRTVNGQRIDTSPARIEGVSTPPNEGQVASVEGAEPNEVHQANIPERRVPEPAPAPPPLPEAAPTKTPRAQIEVGASSANAMPQGATHEVWDQAGKQLLGHVVNGEYVPLEQQ